MTVIEKGILANELIRQRFPSTQLLDDPKLLPAIFEEYNRDNAYLLNMILHGYGIMDTRQVISYNRIGESFNIYLDPIKFEDYLDRIISYNKRILEQSM